MVCESLTGRACVNAGKPGHNFLTKHCAIGAKEYNNGEASLHFVCLADQRLTFFYLRTLCLTIQFIFQCNVVKTESVAVNAV